MTEAMEKVHRVIGEEHESGISDQKVKDTLWYYFFDHEKAIEWLLGKLDASIDILD
jgi:hypothetical protein